MADVTIHRCTLRVRRRGGWSWGADPQRLLQSAVRALPELVARKIAVLWPDESDEEITTPMRLKIRARMTELLAAASFSSSSASDTALPQTAFTERLEQAIISAFEIERGTFTETWNDQAAPASEQPLELLLDSPETERGSALLRLLAAWREQGELEERLSLFTLATLAMWHQALLRIDRAMPAATGARSASKEEIASLVRALAFTLKDSVSSSDRTAVLRQRIVVIVEVVSQLGIAPAEMALLSALDKQLSLDEWPSHGAQTETARRSDLRDTLTTERTAQPDSELRLAEDHSPPLAAPAPVIPQRLSPLRRSMSTEIHISSALPFLLLGPLAQIGYLSALAAILETAQLSEESPLFAAALAYKVLAPPARGWRRDRRAAMTAAAFAGTDDLIPEDALTDFAQRVSTHLAPLNSVLSYSLLKGHNARQPLLLRRTGTEGQGDEGFLLVDSEGLFPIEWAAQLPELFVTLKRFSGATLLIPGQTATPALFRELDQAGLRFITDAPPVRGEHWRVLRSSTAERWHTNDPATPSHVLIRAARQLTLVEDEARDLWQALAIERQSVPLAVDASLDLSLTLAASVSLGTIAWTLWRERERVTPLLALKRFSDLDARVRFRKYEVQVCLPLGRRFQDLNDHGLLQDVAEIPWLDGRNLRFTGG